MAKNFLMKWRKRKKGCLASKVQPEQKSIENLFGLYKVEHSVSDQDIENAIIEGATRGYRTMDGQNDEIHSLIEIKF